MTKLCWQNRLTWLFHATDITSPFFRISRPTIGVLQVRGRELHCRQELEGRSPVRLPRRARLGEESDENSDSDEFEFVKDNRPTESAPTPVPEMTATTPPSPTATASKEMMKSFMSR